MGKLRAKAALLYSLYEKILCLGSCNFSKVVKLTDFIRETTKIEAQF